MSPERLHDPEPDAGSDPPASRKKPVDIFFFDLDGGDCERFIPFLSDDEKERAARYRFDLHRKRFLCNRGYLRQLLAERGDCRPQQIVFGSSRHGKPYISFPRNLRCIQFNTSSSGSLGAVALARDMPVGLDIEKIRFESLDDLDRIVETQFSGDEAAWYAGHQDEAARARAFYSLWTCKEAYLKILGIGLHGRLDGFSVQLEGARACISRTELENGKTTRIHLYLLGIDKEIAGCVATGESDCDIRVLKININTI